MVEKILFKINLNNKIHGSIMEYRYIDMNTQVVWRVESNNDLIIEKWKMFVYSRSALNVKVSTNTNQGST